MPRGIKKAATVRCSPWLANHPIRVHQVEDIRADLGRVIAPFGYPMAVDLPARAGQGVTVLRAPPPDRLVCLGEQVVRAEMHRRGDRAAGGGRVDDFIVPGE